MTRLTYIEGIGEAYAQKLKETGIKSVEDFLEKGASAQSRKELAMQSGINEGMLLRWVNHADLLRIKGIGAEYAELLEAAGVDPPLNLPGGALRNFIGGCWKSIRPKSWYANFQQNSRSINGSWMPSDFQR